MTTICESRGRVGGLGSGGESRRTESDSPASLEVGHRSGLVRKSCPSVHVFRKKKEELAKRGVVGE